MHVAKYQDVKFKQYAIMMLLCICPAQKWLICHRCSKQRAGRELVLLEYNCTFWFCLFIFGGKSIK